MSKITNGMESNIYWIDLCRVIATLGVIAIHASADSFYQFSTLDTGNWLSANAIDSISRISVPLFFLLSGFLIITPHRSAPSLKGLLRRIQRIALPLIIWSTLFLFYTSYYTRESIDFFSILQSPAMYHLWFVYALLGVYLLIPILQKITDLLVERVDYAIYFLVLFFIVNCLPFYWQGGLYGLVFDKGLPSYAGYFVFGAYFKSYLATKGVSRFQVFIALVAFITSSLITFLYTWMLSDRYDMAIQTAYEYLSPNVFIASISFMVLISQIKTPSFSTQKAVSFVSEKTFVIYFVHVVVLDKISNALASNTELPTGLFIILALIVTFFISLILAIGVRMLPKSRLVFG
ncbi:acyltransferase [Halomonas sp. GD1P12]|uniref:acyltransferase n=1 Tax=Halomonas sp. GD1P12 TaxID=2982691 RepID=UPI0021E3D8F4|nr:acyltransferase family protein [Halomonas sp. GD1P12]UYF98746.1 acyltransferase family protein [Halomonas sp. GD1P12]